MDLLIIDTTTESKGTQLERFCQRLFEEFGLLNSTCNVVKKGGSEYDVTAEKVLDTESSLTIPVMAECKAYTTPCNMNHWLKFLGKLHQLQNTNPKAEGYFVALSGVNGNVWGNIQDMNDETVHVICKDNLIEYIKKEYKLSDPNSVRSHIGFYTNRFVDTCDIILCNNQAYWLVRFNATDYSILSADNAPISEIEFKEISMALSSKKFINYIDLISEREKLERFYFIKGLIFCIAFNNYAPDENTLRTFLSKFNVDITVEEIKTVLLTTEYVSHKFPIRINFPACKVELLSYILLFPLFGETLTSKLYQDTIDEELLEEILVLQGKIILDVDKRKECLQILKFSASALSNVIKPDGFIVNSLRNAHLFQINRRSWVNQQAIEKFYKLLIDGMEKDFSNQYYQKFALMLGVKSYNFHRKFTVNDNSDNCISIESSPRIQFCQVDNLPGKPTISIVSMVDTWQGI